MSQKDRIIDLQRSLKIARDALEKIQHGDNNPETTASDALMRIYPLERKAPLQGIVGHERRAR